MAQFSNVSPIQKEDAIEEKGECNHHAFGNQQPCTPSFCPEECFDPIVGPPSALQAVTRSRPGTTTHTLVLPTSQRAHQNRQSCLALWHAIAERFFFRSDAMEADYLAFYLKDRMTPAVVVALITITGLVSFASSLLQFRKYAPSVALRGVAAAMWVLGCIGLVWLARDWQHLLALRSAVEADEGDDDAGETGGRPGLGDRARPRHHTSGSSARSDLIVRQRRNARLQELALLWCNTTFFVVSFSNYLTKGDCALPDEWPDRVHRCMNAIHIDAAVLLAYGLCASICRTRCLLQGTLIIVCTTAYLVAVALMPTSTGFPDTATRRSFAIVAVVVAVLSVVTIWFVDRQARRNFMELRRLEENRDEATRLANYSKRIASSMLPSNVVARLSRGGVIKDFLPDCAVCSVGLHHSARSLFQWSPHEYVESLQHFKLRLDAAARELHHALTKVHTMGDQHTLVAVASESGTQNGALDAGSASALQAQALDVVLTFLRQFVMDLERTARRTSCDDCSRSSTDNSRQMTTSPQPCGLHPVVAVACGGVFFASIGSQCLVAMGDAFDATCRLLRFARRVPSKNALASPSEHDDLALGVRAHIRLCVRAATLLPLCPHRFPEPLQPATSDGATANMQLFRVECAAWCPSAFHSSPGTVLSGNPLDPEESALTRSTLSMAGAAAMGWLQTPSAATVPVVVVEFIDCAADLPPPHHTGDGPVSSMHVESTSSRSIGEGMSKPYPRTPTRTRTSDHTVAHEGADGMVSPADAMPFALERVHLVGLQFVDRDVEYAYHDFVRHANDRGRSQWEFVCMLCVALTMLVVFFVSTSSVVDGTMSVVAVDQPIFWVLVACTTSSTGVILSLCVEGEVVNALLRLVEFVYWASFVLSCVFSNKFQTILGSELPWFIVILELSALRERRQGLMFHCAMVAALAASFIASILIKYPAAGTYALTAIVLIVATSCIGVACFVLWDRFRREQYATTCMIEYVQQQYTSDVMRLERMLEAMIPSALAAKLMDAVRGALRRNTDDQQDGSTEPTTLLGGAGCSKPFLRTRHLWRSPFTSITEDVPMLVMRVFADCATATQPGRSMGGSSAVVDRLHNTAGTFERTRTVAASVLRGRFPSLCLVKFCGDVFMIADQCKHEATEVALVLARAAVRISRELRALSILASAALTSGPLVGAVLGTTAITFEYYGHAASCGMALLEELPRGAMYASSRFAQQVSVQMQHLAARQSTPIRSGSDTTEWRPDVTFGPQQRVTLRDVGAVYVHRVDGSVGGQ